MSMKTHLFTFRHPSLISNRFDILSSTAICEREKSTSDYIHSGEFRTRLDLAWQKMTMI